MGERPYANVMDIEHRGDRAYDERDPSHLIMPNGTLVASYHRGFLAAACREIFNHYREQR